MRGRDSAKDGSLQAIINEFRLCGRVLIHLLSDIDQDTRKSIIYNFDYNLIYPAIWPRSETKDPQYDLIGRNIFSLVPHYAAAIPFKICITVPSALELLDTIEQFSCLGHQK